MTAKKKATAPRPKKDTPDQRAALAERQRQWAEVVVGDDLLRFKWNIDLLPVRVRAHIVDTYGRSVEDFIYRSGRPSPLLYATLWWVVRLAAGETVTRDEVLAEWDERFPNVVLADITDEACDPPEAFAQPA